MAALNERRTHERREGSRNAVPDWLRACLRVSVWALVGSGAWWLIAHYGWGAGANGLPAPSEAWMLRLHGAAAFAALFFIGGIASSHVQRGWKLGRQRMSGVTLCSLTALLAGSGYALYYFTSEGWRPAVGTAHAVLGFAMAALLWWHRRPRR